MPIGGALGGEAEAGGDFAPFGGGGEQGIVRGFLAADGRATALSSAARYSARPGRRKAPSHCSWPKAASATSPYCTAAAAGTGFSTHWLGSLQVRLAKERRGRAGGADLGTHLAVGKPEEQLERGLGVVRLCVDHADPAGERPAGAPGDFRPRPACPKRGR